METSIYPKHKIALVIGNGDYTHSPLHNAVNDAAVVAEALRSIGFEVLEHQNVDQRQFGAVLREFCHKIRPSESCALFYFSGHGTELEGGGNYLYPCPDDVLFDPHSAPYQLQSASQIQAMMNSRLGILNIIILDACRTIPKFESSTVRSLSRGGLQRMEGGNQTIFLFATTPGQPAYDSFSASDGNISTVGPLASAIARHLPTPNEHLTELMQRVRRDVVHNTCSMQVPWESNCLLHKVFLSPAIASPDGGSSSALSPLPLSPESPLSPSRQAREVKSHSFNNGSDIRSLTPPRVASPILPAAPSIPVPEPRLSTSPERSVAPPATSPLRSLSPLRIPPQPTAPISSASAASSSSSPSIFSADYNGPVAGVVLAPAESSSSPIVVPSVPATLPSPANPSPSSSTPSPANPSPRADISFSMQKSAKMQSEPMPLSSPSHSTPSPVLYAPLPAFPAVPPVGDLLPGHNPLGVVSGEQLSDIFARALPSFRLKIIKEKTIADMHLTRYRNTYSDSQFTVTSYIDVFDKPKEFVVISVFPFKCTQERLSAVSTALMAINYSVGIGSFEVDRRTLEIRYKTSCRCEHFTPLSKDFFEDLIDYNMSTVGNHIKVIDKILWSAGMDARDSVKMVRKTMMENVERRERRAKSQDRAGGGEDAFSEASLNGLGFGLGNLSMSESHSQEILLELERMGVDKFEEVMVKMAHRSQAGGEDVSDSEVRQYASMLRHDAGAKKLLEPIRKHIMELYRKKHGGDAGIVAEQLESSSREAAAREVNVSSMSQSEKQGLVAAILADGSLSDEERQSLLNQLLDD